MNKDYITVLMINSKHPHGSVIPCEKVDNNGKEGLRIVAYATQHSVNCAKSFSDDKGNNSFIINEWKEVVKNRNYEGHFEVLDRVEKIILR